MRRSADKSVVFASGNPGKLTEVAELFRDLGLKLVAQGDLGISSIDESGANFVENALLKARHAAAQSGLAAIADDSGLCVDALGGRPGVRSARFAGPHAGDEQNISRLLDELAQVSDDKRTAAFHCAAVFTEADPRSAPLVAEGVWPGIIRRQREGTGGFGYDPVFFDPAAGKSAANMTAAEKNALSHRGRAFGILATLLRERLRSA